MNKQYIVTQTILAAQALSALLAKQQRPDVNSLDKWTEALLRYVLCDNQGDYNPDPHERTQAQYIENLQFQIDKTPTADLLTKLIAAVHAATDSRTDLGNNIIWEPIYDRD